MIDRQVENSGNWYLVQTKFRQENKAAKHLSQQNTKTFIPLHKSEKIVNGRKIIHQEPLFAGYLFVFLESETTNWTAIRSTRGINNIVRFGEKPATVDAKIITELKRINLLLPEPYLKIGREVKIMSGSLKGLRGIYQSPDGLTRSYLLLTFMQQKQYISISNNLLES